MNVLMFTALAAVLSAQPPAAPSGFRAVPARSFPVLQQRRPQANPVADSLRRQLEQCRTASAALQRLNRSLEQQRQGLQARLDAAEQRAEGATARLEPLAHENAALKEQLAALRQEHAALRRQADEGARELDRLRADHARLVREAAGLRQELVAGARQLEEAGRALEERRLALDASARTIAALNARLQAGAAQPWEGGRLMSLARAGLEAGGAGREMRIARYEKDGEVRIVEDLVIGTLEVSYPSSVAAGQTPFPLKAVFKPRTFLDPARLPAGAPRTAWQVELQYVPQSSRASYDAAQSGRKPQKRALDPRSPEETWIWSVATPPDFDTDTAELIVFAGYEEADGRSETVELHHVPVTFSRKQVAGAFARFLGALKENLTYLLGALSLAVGIWATIVGTKKDRLEVRLKELELKLQAVEHPA